MTADAGYGDNTTFRLELEDRDWRYVVAVRGTTSAQAGDAEPVTRRLGGGPGRPPKPGYPAPAGNLRQLAIAHADQVAPVTWRQGTKATSGNPSALMTSHFLAIRVRPANRDIPRAADGSLPECWLLAEWPPAADEPTDYWLSNLPAAAPVAELVRLAKIRWRIEVGHLWRRSSCAAFSWVCSLFLVGFLCLFWRCPAGAGVVAGRAGPALA